MWYQVIVTGSPAATDGATLAALAGALSGAVLGADEALPPEQAANTNVAVAAKATSRRDIVICRRSSTTKVAIERPLVSARQL
jgi:hypothetical protein